MTYDAIAKEIEQLSYRDKLRMAQLLIQLARKEEEEHHPDGRGPKSPKSKLEPELIQYVADRLKKLQPGKKVAVLNSIGAMFQFQGGISDTDKEAIFLALQNGHHIAVAESGRVQYLGV